MEEEEEETTAATTTTKTTNGLIGAGSVVVGVDPGRDHCAVVRYDSYSNTITGVWLVDMSCACDADVGEWEPPPCFGKKPTAYDVAHRVSALWFEEGAPHQRSLRDPISAVFVERQMVQNTLCMCQGAALAGALRPDTEVFHELDPRSVKKFWNQCAAAVGQPHCFDRGAGHHANKANAVAMLSRAFTWKEKMAVEREAARALAHAAVCPGRKKWDNAKRWDRTATRKRKLDDLADAALIAICGAELWGKVPIGTASHRLNFNRGRGEQTSLVPWLGSNGKKKSAAAGRPAARRYRRKCRKPAGDGEKIIHIID